MFPKVKRRWGGSVNEGCPELERARCKIGIGRNKKGIAELTFQHTILVMCNIHRPSSAAEWTTWLQHQILEGGASLIDS
ncbi:hypothetical protein chiPu_0012961 [Chiloscyllium punctatum]|uniref:Uncharacterized protein n=1 Tax=Chiloscyllium punctatum TaxID=137246 RepID=A0A401SVQ3_CHIPU|nr:hypothetical protein [Chiloscyllium punctatum]